MPDDQTPPTPPVTPPLRTPPPPQDDDDDDLQYSQQPAARALRRAREHGKADRDRATAAELANAGLQKELAAAQTRAGSVDRLRQSLLEQAVVAASATLVADGAHGDVLKLLDLSDLRVGDDGVIDQAKIKAKVEQLVKEKPYLAAKVSHSPRPLPGGSAPPPTSGGFNDLLREAVQGRR